MVSSKATTVAAYLATLPADRRAAIAAVRDVIRARLPDGVVEGMAFGSIGYCVPLARYPVTYNGQPLMIAALAAQKSYMALYLMTVYGDPELAAWFTSEYRKRGKRLDMGKSCVRFKALDDLPLDVVGEVIARVSVDDFIARYEAARGGTAAAAKRKPAAKVTAKKQPVAAAKKKPAAARTKPKPAAARR